MQFRLHFSTRVQIVLCQLFRDLPFTWHALFVKSKEIYFRIHGLKEKHCQIVMQKVARLAKKLEELRFEDKQISL